MALSALSGLWRYMRRKMTSRILLTALISVTLTAVVLRSRVMVIESVGLTKSSQGKTLTARPLTGGVAEISIIDYDESKNFYNMTLMAHEHRSRQEHIRHVCEGHERDLFGLSSENWAYGRIEIGRHDHYMYCPLLKVGSTFFRRVFYSIHHKKTMLNPYQVPINRALDAKRNVLTEILPLDWPSTLDFLNKSTSIIFVREPFSRLLSGYVDKLFAPNPYFWSEVGRHIISKFRPDASNRAIKCGHDVTFEEFIRYVIQGEETNSTKRDAHFTPTYDQCKPCELNYTVIGKMENFKQDVAFTLNQLGFNVTKDRISQWAHDATADAIMDSTVSPFSWRGGIRKCMHWNEGLKRIWRKMQMRGIIQFDHKFPWSPEYSESHVNIHVFTKMLKKLHSESDKEVLKKQKLEVLAEAFSTVRKEDLQKLVEIFRPDFELFQYDTHPDFIFDENFVDKFRNRDLIFNLDDV